LESFSSTNITSPTTSYHPYPFSLKFCEVFQQAKKQEKERQGAPTLNQNQ
jgi:hypothetical protein